MPPPNTHKKLNLRVLLWRLSEAPRDRLLEQLFEKGSNSLKPEVFFSLPMASLGPGGGFWPASQPSPLLQCPEPLLRLSCSSFLWDSLSPTGQPSPAQPHTSTQAPASLLFISFRAGLGRRCCQYGNFRLPDWKGLQGQSHNSPRKRAV